MSAELLAMLVTVLTVGVGLAGLIVALWRDMRAELRAVDTELRADIRAVRAAIDADRLAHEALHAAERQARIEERRELLAAIAAIREGTP